MKKKKKKKKSLAALVQKRISMRADKRRNKWNLLAIKLKARTVVGGGKRSLLVTL